MKKIISLIAAICVISMFAICPAAGAADAAPPSDGLEFWVDAGAQNGIETVKQGSSYKVNKWLDISGNGRTLLPGSNKPTYFPDSAKSNLKGNKPAVHFAKNQYMTASGVNYSGDATFIIYYRPLNMVEGDTLFSSHSYTGSAIDESGRIPFSIAVSENKGLAFKMSSEEAPIDMNVPFELSEGSEDLYSGYMALYLTISGKNVSVYSSRADRQTEISASNAVFTLNEAPFWESYAYGMSYESQGKGVICDCPESMIYSRALSLDEVKSVDKYLKLKYEYPVISKIALENEIYEMKKGSIIEPKIIGIGLLLGEESRVDITDAKIKSSDENVILIVNGSLKALDFGSAKITISYEGLPDYSFVVNVPQIVIDTPDIGEADENGGIGINQRIENFRENQPLTVIVAAALYQGDLLLDLKFDKAEIAAAHEFEMNLNKPDNASDTKVYVMVLDGETMVPLNDAVVK